MVDPVSRGSAIRSSLFWNTLSNIVGKTIVLSMGFLLTPYLLNYLGQELYGLWALFGAVLGYGLLLDFGISGAVIRHVSGHRTLGENESAGRYISTALWLYTGIGLLAVTVGILLSTQIAGLFSIRPEDEQMAVQLVSLACVVTGFTIPWILMGAVLRGLQRFDLANLIVVGGSLFYWAGIFAVIRMRGSILSLAGVQLVMTAAMGAGGFWLVSRVAPELRLGWRRASLGLARRILAFSSSLFIIAMASQLETQTDEIVIGALLSVGMITPYYLARRLSEIPQMLTDQFMRVILPLAAQLNAENDREKMQSLYLDSTRLTLLVFVPVAILLIVLGRDILTAWVGVEYAAYAPLLIILTVASLINTSQWPAGSILQGMSRQKLLAWFSAGSAFANLGLSIALIHPLGLAGVALGTLIPTTLENFGFVLPYTMRLMGVSFPMAFRRILLPVLLPAVPMLLGIYGMKSVGLSGPFRQFGLSLRMAGWLDIAVTAGVSLLIYMGIYVFFGANRQEKASYRNIYYEVKLKVQKYLFQGGFVRQFKKG